MKQILPILAAGLLAACSVTAGSGSVSLDNTTKGWGFRKMSPRPEFTAEQTAEMREYGCLYMGAEGEKSLYLTFDEGYENGYTAQILDVLKEKSVPAAFFVTGPYLREQRELVGRMLAEGHIVGNHSVNHPSLPDLTAEEVERELYGLDLMLYDGYGCHMKYLRPPRGEYSAAALKKVTDMGYVPVFWSAAYVDWKTDAQQGAAHAIESIVPQLHDGAVILLHAVSSDNASAMGEIIDRAREQGYEFKSLDEYK